MTRAAPDRAAFVNGVAANALDYDSGVVLQSYGGTASLLHAGDGGSRSVEPRFLAAWSRPTDHTRIEGDASHAGISRQFPVMIFIRALRDRRCGPPANLDVSKWSRLRHLRHLRAAAEIRAMELATGRSVDPGREVASVSGIGGVARRIRLLGRGLFWKASAAVSPRPLRSGHELDALRTPLTSRLSTSRHTRRAAGTRQRSVTIKSCSAGLDRRGCRRGGASRARWSTRCSRTTSRTIRRRAIQHYAVALILHGETAGPSW